MGKPVLQILQICELAKFCGDGPLEGLLSKSLFGGHWKLFKLTYIFFLQVSELSKFCGNGAADGAKVDKVSAHKGCFFLIVASKKLG